MMKIYVSVYFQGRLYLKETAFHHPDKFFKPSIFLLGSLIRHRFIKFIF